jgi:hypothetical protein
MDVPDQLPCKPQERFLEVVVRFGRDFKVRQVLFAVKCDSACLHFALLNYMIESKVAMQKR